MIKFIVGGARAGKTSFAISSARTFSHRRIYIATGMPIDEEMKQKIAAHRRERGKDFETWEEPIEIISLLERIDDTIGVLVFDCLTTWTANMIIKGKDPISYAKEFLKKLRLLPQHIPFYVISNEVGMGIVPSGELSRNYRDILGRINIAFAKDAKEVYFMVAGIPWKIK